MRILSQPPALGTGRHGLPGYGGAIWELTSRALTVAMMKVANSLAPHQPPDNYQTTTSKQDDHQSSRYDGLLYEEVHFPECAKNPDRQAVIQIRVCIMICEARR